MGEWEDSLTTLGELVAEAAAQVGEDPNTIVCFYQPITGEKYRAGHLGAPVRCTFSELPDRRFDDGYGGVNGNPFIGFSDRHVYVYGCYDGSEWISAVPRHPESVGDSLPLIGGG